MSFWQASFFIFSKICNFVPKMTANYVRTNGPSQLWVIFFEDNLRRYSSETNGPSLLWVICFAAHLTKLQRRSTLLNSNRAARSSFAGFVEV